MNSKETVYRLIQKHEDMMRRLDEWFAHLHTLYPDKIKCERGCALCCHGLFDVSLADAVQIIRGYDLLPEDIRMSVRERASLIQRQIKGASGMAAEPLFLNLSQGEIDELVERIDGVRCPFLGTDDECLIYDQRPLACRLEGVPMVDRHDGLFGDWCELNFQNGVENGLLEKLRLDYYEIQAIEQETTGDLSQLLFPARDEEVTIFIPSILTGYDELVRALGLAETAG